MSEFSFDRKAFDELLQNTLNLQGKADCVAGTAQAEAGNWYSVIMGATIEPPTVTQVMYQNPAVNRGLAVRAFLDESGNPTTEEAYCETDADSVRRGFVAITGVLDFERVPETEQAKIGELLIQNIEQE